MDDLGISVLTVHGRTKEQKAEMCGKCNWDAIKEIKKLVKMPVIANGGLGTFEDIDKCFEYTGCDCVMSGEKLIEMPTFFSKKLYDINDIALEYCETWKKYFTLDEINKKHMSLIRGHMFKFFYTACKMFPEYNQKIALTQNLDEVIDIAKVIKEKMKDVKLEDKYGWYMRHRKEKEKKEEENKEDNIYDENNVIDIDSLF